MAERLAACGDTMEKWQWGFAPICRKRFRKEASMEPAPMTEDEEAPAVAAGGLR
jgi:hypothetical protein